MSDNMSIAARRGSNMKKYRKAKLEIERIQADGVIRRKEYFI
jgi:hypothetical protein